jgi:adenylosuccinate synthase
MIDLMGDFSIFTEKSVSFLKKKSFINIFVCIFNRLRNLYNYDKLTFPDLDVDIEKTIENFKQLADYFRPMTIDTIAYLNQAIIEGSKEILVEGANATMLDIDFGIFINTSLIYNLEIHLFRYISLCNFIEL